MGIGRAVSLFVLTFTFLVALILLSSPPASADDSPTLEGGESQFQLYVQVGSDFDLAESGRTIPLFVSVTDIRGIPQVGARVLLTASVGEVSPDVVYTDAAGRAFSIFRADVGESTAVRILATTDLEGAAQGIDALVIRVVRLPPPPIYARAELVSAGVLSGLLILVSWTEPGRLGILGLFFPLYTRLKREAILENFVRGQVFGAIRTEPGVNFTKIRDTLGLSNGGLSYHLKTLEVVGFIRSERVGLYKRFYPAEASAVAGTEGIRLSRLQARLLDLLRRRPETPQRDLARIVGVTQQSVSYNLRILQRQGLLEALGGRRHRRYLVAEP